MKHARAGPKFGPTTRGVKELGLLYPDNVSPGDNGNLLPGGGGGETGVRPIVPPLFGPTRVAHAIGIEGVVL